ncbi:uncharacterized protein SOCE26_024960 [Sorangium cellulosum]|uniref:Uncharacterized protein n=1 Tax=Sorangium cellulosum TaxID=56 RepID=A0A2L0EP65_SORCE|nr:hypothetical protein [Sorangium cellulosum]AUX41091.1 uncharacterized protein SOCE26_024960 [Sorangium cellulosum]
MSQQTAPPGADDPRDPADPVEASDPSTAGAARIPGAAPRGRAPTSGSLRKVIDVVLKGDADLDAFCHDHHADVYRRFSDGMERSRKVTLLLHHASPAAVLASLYEAHRAATQQHEHLLTWSRRWEMEQARPRWLVALALGLVALALAAWKLSADQDARAAVARRGVLEAWRAWSAMYRAIEPFAPQDCGIVLGGPWMATPAGDALCREVRKLHDARAVRCVAPPPGAPEGEAAPLDRAARSTGALLVAEIDEKGLAQVTPLGRLAKDPLLGRRLAIDIAAEADRKRAGIVMSALARLGAPREGFVADDVACPVDPAAPLDALALLALLVVPSCEPVQVHPRSLGCPAGTTTSDEACALARYVDAEMHLTDTRRARHLLTELRDQGAARFRTVAKLLLAHLDCKERALPAASAALRELAEGADACLLAQVSEVAACVASSAGPGAVEPAIVRLEALPIDPKGECPELLRARALARRGYWRERSERWSDALADYERAWHLSQDPRDGLSLAEVWLHEGEPGQAAKVLSGVDCDAGGPPSCHATAALLRWLAAGDALERKHAEVALLRLHEQRGSEAAVLGAPTDRLLRSLACPGPASAGCLYDVLTRPAPRGELLQALRAAERSGPPRR